MRNSSRLSTAVVSVVFAATICPQSAALGAFGELEEPWVATAPGYSEENRAKVHAVLKRTDCTYLGGHWLNSHTALRYAGDTKALNLFMEALSQCPDVTLHVNFSRLVQTNDRTPDWMVTQMAPSNHLVIRINLASEAIDLERLYIPDIKSSAAAE